MQDHSPNTDEQPTSLADLTVETVPLLPDNTADIEQPTLFAIMMIMEVPLPPWDLVEGSAAPGEPEPAA
jgi:hypothetical protein